MPKEVPPQICPVAGHPLQAFYTDRLQLFDLIEALLHQLDGACSRLFLTSFSVSEEFIRKIYRFRREMPISQAVLLLDAKAAAKVSKLLPFARSVLDEIYLCNNHGKVVLFDAATKISVCTSQNQTRGNRRESTLVTTAPGCYHTFLEAINEMMKTGIKL